MLEGSEVNNENNMIEAQTSPGNTKQARLSQKMLRSRAFQLTVWKLDTYEEIKKYLTGLQNFGYFLAYKEIGELKEGEHIHIYVHFNIQKKIWISKCLGAHIEICRGTPKQNIDYISKQGNKLDEIGEIPKQGNRTDITSVEKMSKEDRKTLPINYYKIIERINEKEENELDIDEWKKDVTVYWIWGETGVGKTEKAKELVREYYKTHDLINGKKAFNCVKYVNNFWNGVGENRVIAIYDDFRDSHMKPSEFINFIDYNIQDMNIKGGNVKNTYKLIIITSVQNPREIYAGMKDEEPRKQWLRRMKIIHMEKLNMKNNDLDIDDF